VKQSYTNTLSSAKAQGLIGRKKESVAAELFALTEAGIVSVTEEDNLKKK
jgi:hypothetical protein